MKAILALAAAIIILTSCVPPTHEDRISASRDLGFNPTGDIDHPCAQEQLEKFSLELTDETSKVDLARFALNNNITEIKVQVEDLAETRCKRVIISGHEDMMPKSCDESTLIGEVKELGKTEISMQDGVLEIFITAQASINTDIIYSVEESSVVESTINTSLKTKGETNYIDLKMFDQMSKIQNFIPEDQIENISYSCSEMLTADQLLAL